MKNIIIFVLLTLLPLSFPSFADATTELKYTIRQDHPRLYLTKERLTEIRRRCADKKGAQARYYAVLKDFGDRFNPAKSKPSANHCLCLAFLYAVGEVPGHDYSGRSVSEYGKLGAGLLTRLSPPRDLSYFLKYAPVLIACYDWLFSAMTPGQRAAVFNNYTTVCDKMRDSLATPIGNRWRGTREAYAYYGLAFYGDGRHIYPSDPHAAEAVDKKAKAYCDFFASWQIGQNLVVFETACKGGAYPDGTMYGESPYPIRLWPLDAWNTAGNKNLYSDVSCLTGYPLFWLYQMVPYRTAVRYDCANGRSDQPGGLVRFGDYRYIGHTAVAGPKINIAHAQGIAATQSRKDLAAAFNWLIQYQGDFKVTPYGGPFPVDKRLGASPNLVWDIIFRDGLVKAESPADVKLPLACHFGSIDSGPKMMPDFPDGRPEGAGVAIMRSSWDDHEPEGTLLWFKASSHMLSHSHRDQGSFQIYKKGWLAIDSGQYEETSHRGNYNMRTVAHNSLLVYQPGENLDKDVADPIWYGFANDGGQRWVRSVTNAAETKDAERYLGGITRFESVPGVYDYLHSDITRAYNCIHVTTESHKPKVSLVMRSIVFLRPDEYVVVFDHVVSVKAEYPKRWLLHSIYRPELDGKETFEGVIPYSDKIPGKPQGVRLTGSKKGGISESKDTRIVTIKGWNFGPSDGRLVCRTLLPEKHITRVVGGSDPLGVRKTTLVRPHERGGTIFVEGADGFEDGDFVYLGVTEYPYERGSWGRPNWPVDDLFYRGWGKVKSVDRKANALTMLPYGSGIPKLPQGAVVVRSDHANAKAFEFMDAEYNQWPMRGESVANAGPFHMQHGCWRIEVEPIKKKKDDFFLHVMLPCDKQTLAQSGTKLKENVSLEENNDSINLDIKGESCHYKLIFKKDSTDACLTVTQKGGNILEYGLSRAGERGRSVKSSQ